MNVRPATEADSREIHRVHVAAVRGLPPGRQDKAGIERWLAAREPEAYARDMDDEYMVVAEEGGTVIGWGAFNADKRAVTNVFVDPPHHRRGAGTSILRALENAAREAGLRSIHLQAAGTAIEFYRANGYRTDSPVESGAEWALMKKAL